MRHGKGSVGWPLEFGGLSGEEVTIANVLSDAGYATAFYSNWHLGDIEESYPHSQGFDEAFFDPYNQISNIWNDRGDAVNVALNVPTHLRKQYPYLYASEALNPTGFVIAIEGRKGELGREWKEPSPETYEELDLESESRIMEFIDRKAGVDQPFFITYWPQMLSFFPKPETKTTQWGLIAEGLHRLDQFIGELMDKLRAMGLADNTLIVAHADNGPMTHNPPAGMGLAETIFRGGKGDFTEGGVRVPAYPRIGDATQHIPNDRIIDGLDQSSLLLKGDSHGRRDDVQIYTGTIHAATVK